MSDLYSYLNLRGPEYSYLGHFNCSECLTAGHNTNPIEAQIDAGNIPNLNMDKQQNLLGLDTGESGVP